MTEAVVRTPDGAILGIDYRQSELADPRFRVPGTIPARAVMPGDTIEVGADRGVVQHAHAAVLHPGRRRVSVVSDRGARLVFEFTDEQLIDVVGVGAFEPKEGDRD